VIENLTIPDSGHVTEDTSWSIEMIAVDDWTIVSAMASMDGGESVQLVLEEGKWVLDLEDLSLGEHTVTITVEDEWGLTTTRTVTFEIIDLGPPTGTVTVEDGDDVTNSTQVELTWETTGDRSVPWVRYGLSPDMSDAGDWESNDGSGVLEYDGPDGEVTVYLWFKDDRDRVSEAATDTVLVDTTPPVIVITKPASHTTTRGKVTFHFEVTDNMDDSPFYYIRWSYQDPWEELEEPTYTVTLREGGAGVMEVSAMDHAGNRALLTFRLEREVEPSGLSTWLIVMILVVAAVVGAGLWMWTRRNRGQ
jgi:hypothetical protein